MSFDTQFRDNQTPAHRSLVEKSITWLANRVSMRGFRGTTEWSPSSGYSADFLALAAFQRADAVRYEKFRMTQNHPPFWFPPSAIVDYDPRVMVFEAKAFRADFLRTFGKRGSDRTCWPLGNLHWVVCGKSVADVSEIPPFWGMLLDRGRGLAEVKRPTFCYMTLEKTDQIGHEMLWARESWFREYEAGRLDLATKLLQPKRRKRKR